MTVTDLTPIQLYGLIVLAFINITLGLLAFRAYDDLRTNRQRFVFWLGISAIYGIPSLIGLMVLRL